MSVDAAYGEPTAFREELEKRELRYALGIQSNVGIWMKPPKRIQGKPAGMGRPPTAWNYGEQKPVSLKEAALKAKGWKTIRWREGSKGWLEPLLIISGSCSERCNSLFSQLAFDCRRFRKYLSMK